MDYSNKISRELNLPEENVKNTIDLLNNGASVPFIARYRKEMTASLDEVLIAKIRDRVQQLKEIDKRRESILNSIEKQDKLTKELEEQIYNAESLSELEDIYLPYKPKRKTRASIAISKGLEPLAKQLILQYDNFNVISKASEYINKEKKVPTAEDALSGARDIIAEWVNENKRARQNIRNLFKKEAVITSEPVKNKELEGIKYEQYFDYKEKSMHAPSHRILAMFRGENEGFLKLNIDVSEADAILILKKIFIKAENLSSAQVLLAVKDGYKRLLKPSIVTELRSFIKEKADKYAIKIFAENLRQLLLAPPLGQKRILAIDPGFRTGCKIVCLNSQGKLLHNETIYPHQPQNMVKESMNKILSLVNAYNIEAIAIGNGTAGRETENLIRKIRFDKDIKAVMVNESGASVYSASDVAREEFPDYDVTVRGAVSIGRRLMDPLAELVKIDPKSIGVGQYQHDVNQNLLQKSLNDVVESCVNLVGVDINTASKELLTYVSGVGQSLAKNIVDYRNNNGAFQSREELKKVPRFGAKVFEQAAGFLRIQNAENILDSTAVHPESYYIVYNIARENNSSLEDLIKNEDLRNKININDFVDDKVGIPTLKDIISELAKPGRDPRKKIDFFEFTKGVNKIQDVKPGMRLNGIVTNITAFGAFVDIGVHQDGLIHISQMADRFVKDPNEIVKLNQKLKVKVISVDVDRKRIQLSLKE